MERDAKELQPAMQAREIALYQSLLNRAVSVLEYGVGGSTLMAVRSHAETIVSVDSDPRWLENVRTQPEIAEAERTGRLRLIHVDLGPVGVHAYPTDKTRQATWGRYSAAPWEHEIVPDLILVDGRFRVACAAKSLLHCASTTTVVIHDFWNRAMYHSLLPYLHWVASADTMGAFRPAQHMDRGMLQSLFNEYATNPR